MKRALLPFLIAAAGLLAWAAQPAVTGKWQVYTNVGGTENDGTCTFAQTGAALTGTCDPGGSANPIAGKVDGQAISWSYHTVYNGDHITAVFNGQIESAGKIAGTLTVPEYDSEGTFTAIRAPVAPAK